MCSRWLLQYDNWVVRQLKFVTSCENANNFASGYLKLAAYPNFYFTRLRAKFIIIGVFLKYWHNYLFLLLLVNREVIENLKIVANELWSEKIKYFNFVYIEFIFCVFLCRQKVRPFVYIKIPVTDKMMNLLLVYFSM